jgi:transcriptional regulator with XRE-family HTH domain
MIPQCYTRIAGNIRYRRRLRNLTQRSVAIALGVNRVTYSQIENGHRPPQVHELFLLAHILDCHLDDLLAGAPDPPPVVRI